MDSIVLAGGFGTRLGSIVEKTPKPLLEVGRKPVLSYIFRALDEFYSHDDINGTCYLTVNKKFQAKFKEFLKKEKYNFTLELIVEDSDSEENKLGTERALNEVLKNKITSKEILVIAGDNIFSFEIYSLYTYFKKYPKRSIVALYDIKDLEKAKKYGCAVLDGFERKIIKFEEKPENPSSTLVNTTCYILENTDLEKIRAEFDPKEDIGHLDWLFRNNAEINGFVFEGYWFDIGTPESLDEARKYFR